jgi:hypothetical protein
MGDIVLKRRITFKHILCRAWGSHRGGWKSSFLAICFMLIYFLAYSSTLKMGAFETWFTFNGLHDVISQKIKLLLSIPTSLFITPHSSSSSTYSKYEMTMQLLVFWTLSIVQSLFKNNVSETGFCLRPQVKAQSTELVSISGFYLRTETESSLRNVVFK